MFDRVILFIHCYEFWWWIGVIIFSSDVGVFLDEIEVRSLFMMFVSFFTLM